MHCKKQYYPWFHQRNLEGIDVVREQSIIDNTTRSFIFRDHGKQVLEGDQALKNIARHASDLRSDKSLNYESLSTTEFPGISYYVQREGNNVSFLSNDVSNILIRWNANLDSRTFVLYSDQLKKQRDNTNDGVS